MNVKANFFYVCHLFSNLFYLFADLFYLFSDLFLLSLPLSAGVNRP